ncbi:PLP-dependent aminotransferase family protein [Saccharothrix sp. Mg75]|uniref:aminotransferase-like domain-containing protein n=1 Tax=Saccharothrix sp. Mg75 TaxID=3445357 RepID=UPI003EE84DBC
MLPMTVDRHSPVPMTAQIQDALRDRILDGTLHAGTRLPSSRHLATDVGVSRGVVVQAYGQLITEGYLSAEQGSGTRVAAHLPRRRAAVPPADEAVRFDLRAHATSMTLFPGREWLASYQHVIRSMDRGIRPRRYPQGVPALRAELAGYLGRTRGVIAEAGDLVITSGFAHTLDAVCGALRMLGVTRLAVEDPGDQRHAQVASRAGLEVVPVPVDRGSGLDVDALARSGARAVLVNPVAQVPTGAVLSPSRAEALLGWASAVDGWVIEHDLYGHLWLGHGGEPLALQRRSPSRVVYAGQTRELLGPCLRLGWLAAPGPVLDALDRTQAGRAVEPDALTQLGLADFLARGSLDQHVRRVRGTYRRRREAVVRAVRRHLPGLGVVGGQAGTHAYVPLPPGVDARRLVSVAGGRGVLADHGARFRLDPRPVEAALVLGYAAVERGRVDEAVAVLGHAVERYPHLLAPPA